MKNPLLIGSGVALLALGTAPYFISNDVESKFNQTIEYINSNAAYSADVATYEKGWFSTHAEVDIGLDLQAIMAAQGEPIDPNIELDNYSVRVHYDVHHGLFYFGENAGVGLAQFSVTAPADSLRQLLSWDENAPIYQIQGTIGLLGALNYEDQITSFTFKDEDSDSTFTFSGYQGKAISLGGTTQYEGNAESFTGISSEFGLDVEKVAVSLNWNGDFIAAISGGLFDSKAIFSIADIRFSAESLGEEQIALNELVFDVITKIDEVKNNANIEVIYSLKSLNAKGYNASDLSLGIAVNNLDMDFMRAYQTFANETIFTQPELLESEMQAFVSANLLPLLSASPELNITQLTGTIPEGSFEGTLNTKLVDISSLPDNLANPTFWVSHALADAKLSADEGIVKLAATSYVKSQLRASPQGQELSDEEISEIAVQQSSNVLAMFTQQGFITADEGKYNTELSLENGKAQINGTEIPLPFGE